MGYRGPPPRGGAGRPRRDPPPPTPPTGPQAPRKGGWSPAPARERSRSATCPPAPAAGSHRGRGEQASPRQRARTPHRSRPVKTGEHEPEWYGGPRPPLDRTTPVTPALLPAQGKQRDGTRQSDPPPYRPPRPHKQGARRTGPRPPPPARPPAHERHGPAPRRADPTGRADQGDREGPPHPHTRAHSTWIADPNSPPSGRAVGGGGAPDPRRPSQQWELPPSGTPFRHPHKPKPSRGEPGSDRPPPSTPDGARDRGRTRGGARTRWNGATSAQCRDRGQHPGGGGADAAGARAHTHAKGTRGLPEGQPDGARGTHNRVERRISERG